VVYNAEVQAMLYRLVRPMQRKGSRNVYFQQRIPADVKQGAIGRRLEFLLGGEMVSVAVTERSHAISSRSDHPTPLRSRCGRQRRRGRRSCTGRP
jgi:hypothetical protein